MRTKKNLKTSLEPLQPLNLLNQFFLVIKDQQQVLKDQLSVTVMLMKKVNVVSNTVHRVTIPKEDSVLSRSLRSDRWWAFDNYTGNTQVCNSSRIILLPDFWKWNSTGDMQLGHYTVCTTISLYLNDRGLQLRKYENWSSKRKLTVQPDTCWNVVWLPAEEQQEQEPKWDPLHGSISPRSTRIL